jgi:putative ABC transport system ATP-binding protein
MADGLRGHPAAAERILAARASESTQPRRARRQLSGTGQSTAMPAPAHQITTLNIACGGAFLIRKIGKRIYYALLNFSCPPPMSFITLVNARRTYRLPQGPVHAIDGIDLRIGAGDYLAVTGPSGSGKSTLLNLLALLDTASDGEHWWRGARVDGAGETQRQQARAGQVGYIFQRCHLIERYTVADNIGLGLNDDNGDPAQGRQRIDALLARYGLQLCGGLRPSQLSLGQQQCVAICRAAIAQAPLLLADEPTAHLDAQQAAQTMLLLRTLHQSGATVVLASHDAGIAAHASRIVQLAAGRIVADAEYR